MMRRLVVLAAVAAVVATALPAEAAKVTPLYFVNTGAPEAGGCTQALSLSTRPQDGNECSGTFMAADGAGIIKNDSYATSKKTFKLDASRPLTGSVYVSHFPIVFVGAADSVRSLPGYVVLDITYKIDSTKIGVQHIEGVVPPVDGLKADFSFKIPASLKNKTVGKVSASIVWTTAVGLSGISYTSPTASVVNLPTR